MKKGYSLIEVIICISLLGIVSTFVIFNLENYNKKINDIKVKQCGFAIASLINNSKLYCRQADSGGEIIFFVDDQEIRFYNNGKLIERLVIPNGITLNTFKTPGVDNIIRINESGISKDACTISFRDSYNVNHYITVTVGSTYVEIKK